MSGDADTASGDADATSGDADATSGDADATSGDADTTSGDADATSGDADTTSGDADATSGDVTRAPDGADPTKVAIACQGGGSHSAFTAGVLRGLLRDWDPDRHTLVGLSGTSGGAFNALATWYGLVTADAERSVDLLGSLWAELAATDPADRLANDVLVGFNRVESTGYPLPSVSPYHLPWAELGQNRIRTILEDHVDFDAIPDLCRRVTPELVVGTVDVNGGEFETFTNEEVSTEAVLASAAVPNLFRAVELHGHLHWDGLFSQNPPVNDLMTVQADRKPAELWIVQVNPQRYEGTPTSLDAIADRRNELSGNISLNQELRFIRWVNGWIDEGYLPRENFSRTEIRRIEMGRRYNYATKLDRSPAFVEELLALGERRAGEFLDGLEE